ncbi:excalibur calcium-binding domain-containing protein [Rhodococcus aetherivorans]|uniref:excalibur calcium-binding domain-containing protein n=1 Tax=Rhodococcus aetherivorans TaxID=191292 RepID=UPI003CD01FBE
MTVVAPAVASAGPLSWIASGSGSGSGSAGSSGPSYANCTEARQAGVTPIFRGEPGYASHLDGDNDGVACE